MLESKGKKCSDHSAILLSQGISDRGNMPFRVFNTWLEKEHVMQIFFAHWDHLKITDKNIHSKIKSLRKAIKV